MHFAFLAIGLAMPLAYHIPFHLMLILNIVISNSFNHYDSFDQMISLALPVFIGVCAMLFILENSYADHYMTLKELELSFITDQLTGTYNRYILKELVNDETESFWNEKDIFIAMVDIDHFKNVNDTFGHSAGDKILCSVGNRIKTNIFSDDVVIRWGGEEFVIILVGYNLNRASAFCNRLRKEIENEDNGICPITISVGLAAYNPGDVYHLAIDNADKALYVAKKNGRNQVVNYSSIKYFNKNN